MPINVCQKCGNKGLICIRYHDGAVLDIALCDCRQGLAMREFDDEEIRTRIRDIPAASRIANLEDFKDDAPPPNVSGAGRRPLRSRL